jgi:hypothetical protein
MNYEKSQLWILGDSFTQNGIFNSWPKLLQKKFIGEDVFLNSTISGDIQTIMDTFYKNMQVIKKDSLVLIFLPSLARIRFPKKKEYFDKNLATGTFIQNKNEISYNFDELFIHWPYKEYPNPDGVDELEFPFDTFNFNGHQNGGSYYVGLYYYKNRELWENAVVGNVNNFDFARLLLANSSTTKNWNDILQSIKNTFPFHIEFFSWTDELDPNIVWTKERITKEIGFWHTMNDDWNDTNGESGEEYDEHFSHKMHNVFTDMIIEKYPSYFKN